MFDAADKIDVLLVGLGKDIAGFPKPIREALRERKIIVEAIATGGAVRAMQLKFHYGIMAAFLSAWHRHS